MQGNYSEFQLGNWVINHPEGNYCTIKSLSPNIILQGALHTYPSTIERIGKVKITEDKLQVCGFEFDYPYFLKKYSIEIYVIIAFSSSGIHKLYKNDEEFCDVQFIHQVQNVYYKLTGELLQGNLYGVRER